MKKRKGCLVAVAAFLGFGACVNVVAPEDAPQVEVSAPVVTQPVPPSPSGTSSPSRATPASDPWRQPVGNSDRFGPSTTPAAPATTAPVTTPKATPRTVGAAAETLDRLPVKGRAPKTGYTREQFPHWEDTDGDGCDADDQAVIAAATTELAGPCRVAAATMDDPYTGQQVRWSGSRANIVDVDHVVSISNAWQTGAQQLDIGRRRDLANDPLNLVPTSASVNRAKGDGDAATWLPPRKAYRCEYVARQVAVKAKYGLWVTRAERDAMSRVLESCPRQELPGPQRRVPEPAPTSTTTPRPTRAAPTQEKENTMPSTCKAVKAAGLGPYRRGIDPEYGQFNDRDGDGVVCE